MNKVILTGNLCKDIELRYTPNNTAVLMNTVGVSREFKNANNEYETDFINIVVFGKSAEYLQQYAAKGARVELVGRWQLRQYQDNQGITQYVNECVVENIRAFSKPVDQPQQQQRTNYQQPQQQAPRQQAPQQNNWQQPQYQQQDIYDQVVNDDDLPF